MESSIIIESDNVGRVFSMVYDSVGGVCMAVWVGSSMIIMSDSVEKVFSMLYDSVGEVFDSV